MVVDMTEETRICNRCGISKYLYEFRVFRRKNSEKTEYRTICLDCENKMQRNRYKEDPEKYRRIQQKYVKNNPEAVTKTTRKYRSKNRDKININHLKWLSTKPRIYKKWAERTIKSHIDHNLNVDINLEYLTSLAENTTYCSMCGAFLKWEYGKGSVPNSPTLDRISNDKYMNMYNVWIICRKCNTLKGRMKMPDFVAYCKTIVEKFG